MKKAADIRITAFLLSCLLMLAGSAKGLFAQQINWQQIDHGLEYGTVSTGREVLVGDGVISILRIDPRKYDLQLVAASEHGGRPRTAGDWCRDLKMVAAVNAGMFLQDGLTNVGYMKNYSHVNHARFNKDNTLVAFHPISDSLPPFQIIDRTCQDWESLVEQYQSVTQGIRMIDCQQKNRWSQQPRIWSMVIVAADKDGNALFIFCRSPYSVHDFIDILLGLPLRIYNAMYLEGGPEASFFIDAPDCKVNRFGSYETGFYESDGNDQPWPIPNVIGVRKAQK